MQPFITTLLTTFALLTAPGPAPVAVEDTPHFCLFDEALEAQLAARPDLAATLLAQDEAAARALGKNRPSRLLEDYTLPVVVHVVNPPNADTIAVVDQVMMAINFLNAAFANNAPFDPNEGVNTQTQFCLATRDPEGMPSNGITYTESELSDVQFELDDEALKALIRWEPTEYINVYVVNEVATFSMGEINVEGYAYPPALHGSAIDGIVIEADNFGAAPQTTVPFVHQMGHYLGLYHTFEGACENENCLLDGDRVCDTPPDQTTVAVPCDFEVNSCETDVNPDDPNNPFTEDQNDLQNNYLDFSDIPCYNMFTLGQAERMQFFIEQVRFSLLETNSCLPPCPIDVIADYGSNPVLDSDSIVVGAFFNFFSTSTNADSSIWRLNGDSIGIGGSVDVQFDEVGTQTLVLTVFNDSSALCIDQFLVNYEVFCPVVADFEVSDLYATPGQDVLFTNTSVGANSFEWSLNGTVVSTDSNYVYVPTNLGTDEICLRAVGDLCEDTRCITLTCTTDGANCTSRAFLTQLTLPNASFFTNSLVLLPNGNQLHGVGLLDGIALIETDETGEIVAQQKLAVSGTFTANAVVDMLIDDEGHLGLLYSVTTDDNELTPGALRYDLETQSLLWVNTFPRGTGEQRQYSGMIDRSNDGQYLLVGEQSDPTVDLRPLTLTLDRTTGAVVSAAAGDADAYHLYSEVVVAPDGGYVTVGTSGSGPENSRLTLSRFDATGSLSWRRRYGPDQTVPSRRRGQDLVLHDSTIAFAGSGNPNGSSPAVEQGYFYTANLAGDPLSALRVDVAGAPADGINTISRIDDGYILAGVYGDVPPNFAQEIFVMRISDAGDLIWSTGLTDNVYDISFNLSGHVDGDSYYLASARLDLDVAAQTAVTFARVNLSDGSVGSEPCAPAVPLAATLTVLPLESLDFPQAATAITVDELTVPFDIVAGTFVTDQQCATLCEEIACNGLDDDGDGLIDCCDPDAAGQACCIGFEPLEISPNGSDVYMACDNEAVVLNAGAGYQSYLWHDGSTDSIFTTRIPGTYYVTVMSDNCGGIETDTVKVLDDNELVAEILPGVAQVCPGDTVFFEMTNPFQTVNWLPEDQVDCDTCRTTFTVVGEEPVEIIGIGRYSSGCYSVDTLFITINTFGGTESITKCAGEAVDVFGEPQVAPGAYTMTFSSFEGCDSIVTITVMDFPLIAANINVETFCDDGTLFGNLTASAGAGAGGPFSFVWEDGTTGPQLLNQPAGDYTVTITDGEGCTISQTATVENNLDVSVSGAPDCLDGAYAETATASGVNGAAPFTFDFSDGPSQLLPGTYAVTVTDANGCTASANFDVADNASLAVELSDIEVVCLDGISATATALPSGGVGPYTFAWSTGETEATATALETGTNTLTVTDAAGCTAETTAEVALQTIEGIELPNTIIPNDPDNNTFAPVYAEGASYEVQSLLIYNRWGQLIFESTEPDASWDGTQDGEPIVMDVYVYRITIGCGSEEGLSFFGDLTVVR